MSDDIDQLEFADQHDRDLANGVFTTSPHPGKYHEMIDNLEELKEFIKEQNREIARLKEVAETQALRANCLTSTVNDLRIGSEKKRKEYEKALGEVMTNRDAWIESHGNRVVEIGQLRKDVAQLKQSHVSRESAKVIAKMTADRDELQKSLTGMTDGRDWWRNTAKARVTIISMLEQKSYASSEQIATLTKDLAKAKEVCDEWQLTAESRRKEIITLKNAEYGDRKALESCKSANEYLKRDLDEATAEGVEQAKQIKELQVIVNDLNVRTHQMKTDGTDRYAWHMAEGYSKVIDTQSGTIREQEKTIDEQRKQVETLQDGLEDLRKRYLECVSERVKMSAELAELRVSVQPYRPDCVVIPKSELRENLLKLESAWRASLDVPEPIDNFMQYLEQKIG